MPHHIGVPVGLLTSLAVRLMPPVVEFGAPVQRGRREEESFWHIPVTIHPRIFRRIGPAALYEVEIYLDEYRGEEVINKIRLCWGDAKFENPTTTTFLRRGDIKLVPVVIREEEESDGSAYVTDIRYFEHRERVVKLAADRRKHRYRLRVKSGTYETASKHIYVIRVPRTWTNGQFSLEIEYESGDAAVQEENHPTQSASVGHELVANAAVSVSLAAPHQAHGKNVIDFAAWDRRSKFTLREAAQLWANIPPTPECPLSQMADVILNELIEAGKSNELATEIPMPRSELAQVSLAAGIALTGERVFFDSLATRSDLRSWAEAKDERPAFLFPEDRGARVSTIPDGFLALNRAAKMALAHLEGTPFLTHIEEIGHTTDEITRLVMLNIGKHGGDVTGVKWPSGQRVSVWLDLGRLIIDPEENCLRRERGDKAAFTELATTKVALDEFVRFGKSVSGEL